MKISTQSLDKAPAIITAASEYRIGIIVIGVIVIFLLTSQMIRLGKAKDKNSFVFGVGAILVVVAMGLFLQWTEVQKEVQVHKKELPVSQHTSGAQSPAIGTMNDGVIIYGAAPEKTK